MLLDSNWGNAAMQLLSLDPAVVSEDNGMDLDPVYNLFEEKNGFRKDGSTFPDKFILRFQRKQGERNSFKTIKVWNFDRSILEVAGNGVDAR